MLKIMFYSFSEEERQSLEETIDRATEAVKTWMLEGIDKAMNEFNRKGAEFLFLE